MLSHRQQRGLTPADVRAAMMTYTPSGKMDEYYLFLSGGQSGNVVVVGVPSMRILKSIAVFTPESWQGYGYGDAAPKRCSTAATSTTPRSAWATPTTRP